MPRKPDLRLGIDVGGTNTDAVILDLEDQVVARSKQSTTTDVTSGIQAAIAAVVAAGLDKSRITHVMLGTTHATNAVLERRRLHKVAVLRVGAPSILAVRPMYSSAQGLGCGRGRTQHSGPRRV